MLLFQLFKFQFLIMAGKQDKVTTIQHNCPVLIPKENIKFFTATQKACSVNPYGNYGNAYNKKLL